MEVALDRSREMQAFEAPRDQRDRWFVGVKDQPPTEFGELQLPLSHLSHPDPRAKARGTVQWQLSVTRRLYRKNRFPSEIDGLTSRS